MPKKFFSVKEAAEYSSLSPRFLYELIQRRALKHYKIGRRIILNVEDLENFIRKNIRDERDWEVEARDVLKD